MREPEDVVWVLNEEDAEELIELAKEHKKTKLAKRIKAVDLDMAPEVMRVAFTEESQRKVDAGTAHERLSRFAVNCSESVAEDCFETTVGALMDSAENVIRPRSRQKA